MTAETTKRCPPRDKTIERAVDLTTSAASVKKDVLAPKDQASIDILPQLKQGDSVATAEATGGTPSRFPTGSCFNHRYLLTDNLGQRGLTQCPQA